MGAPPPSQFAKVVARRRQGGFLQLPCSLGFRLAFSATGGARLCPPFAFEKSGGKLAVKLFWFLTEYAGGPLIGSGPLVLFAGSQGEKGWRMDRLAGGKSQRPGRGGGRAQRAQSMGGGPWPPPMLWFCGPFGPAKRRRPAGAHPSASLLPRVSIPPSALRRLPGGMQEAALALVETPPPPLRYVFHQRQKGNAKARPFDQPGHAPSTARKKAVATASRAVRNGAYASCAGGRCPRFYGSSPGDRRSADRTYRKGTGGLPAFQRGKGRY